MDRSRLCSVKASLISCVNRAFIDGLGSAVPPQLSGAGAPWGARGC